MANNGGKVSDVNNITRLALFLSRSLLPMDDNSHTVWATTIASKRKKKKKGEKRKKKTK